MWAAGPLTQVGTVSDHWRIEVTAVDPLADEYRALCEEFGLARPGVLTRRAEAETLADALPGEAFDLIFCRNALDHTRDPLVGIRQMVSLCKADGAVFLTHSTDEGKKQRYRGLHQWNFSPQDEDLLIRAPGRRPTSLRLELSGTATVQVTKTGVSAAGTKAPPRGWHTVVIRPAPNRLRAARSFLTVFSDTSDISAVARMELPPRVSALRIWIRRAGVKTVHSQNDNVILTVCQAQRYTSVSGAQIDNSRDRSLVPEISSRSGSRPG